MTVLGKDCPRIGAADMFLLISTAKLFNQFDPIVRPIHVIHKRIQRVPLIYNNQLVVSGVDNAIDV